MQAAGDDHQQIVEIMRHAAGELAERVELLGFRQLLLHLLEPELGLAPLGDVAGDLGEADDLAALAHRIDHDTGPEERPVLADAPAFFLVAAGFLGDPQRAQRLAVGAVGFGVEAGEVPAEDLLGRIALDALAADIPAGDDPGRIEHIKGVVGDILDQKPETAFAFEQIRLVLLVFSEHSSPYLAAETRAAAIGSFGWTRFRHIFAESAAMPWRAGWGAWKAPPG